MPVTHKHTAVGILLWLPPSKEPMADRNDFLCPPQPHATLDSRLGCWLLWDRLRVIGQGPGCLLKGCTLGHGVGLQVKGFSLRQKVQRHGLGCGRLRGCLRLLLGLR